jgi:uncharacterized OsmC-like protein
VASLPHRFHVTLRGGPDGYATAALAGAPEISTAPPPEFDGPGDAWSPEHLLLASVETCFLFTLRAVARASRVPFTDVSVAAEGTVDRQDGGLRFTEIVLRARVVVPAGVDHERAARVMDKSERACLVTASLATPVRLVPEVVTG